MATSTNDAPRRSLASCHLVGGKGGVGKTTCAAALGLTLAESGARTLVISTDPAPSLGDALSIPLAASPRQVPGARGPFFAAEIDAPLALRRWLRGRKETLQRIALRGTWLDESDVASLLALSVPGIDEIAGLLELARHVRSSRFDVIVMDTAPAGHTLRMLLLPDTLAGVAAVFDTMQDKHRVMVSALRGSWSPDDGDALIGELREEAAGLSELLRNRHSTKVSWVTTAEALAIEETIDAFGTLAKAGISVDRLIVNRLTPVPSRQAGPRAFRCGWCAARRRAESHALAGLASRLPRAAGTPAIVSVSARHAEPVGLRALRSIGRELTASRSLRPRSVKPPAPILARSPWRGTTKAVGRTFGEASLRLLLFGGKGGVGKTTCAAAAALHLARTNPRRRLLLLSTDPAHSLGDVVEMSVGASPRRIPEGPPNLDIRHLDPSRALDSIRERYKASIDALFDRLAAGSRFDAVYDRRVMHRLFDLAPPGLDELLAVLEVLSLLEESDEPKRYDSVVVDTAPTGHAIRLLEMPALVREWVQSIMKILLKYQPIGGLGDTGAALLELSKGLGRLRTWLVDPRTTGFIVVTRAAALPVAETRRLLNSLKRLRVNVPGMIVNAVGAGECVRCRSMEAAERRWIGELRSIAVASGISEVTLGLARVPPPRGQRVLLAWQARWVGVPALSSTL